MDDAQRGAGRLIIGGYAVDEGVNLALEVQPANERDISAPRGIGRLGLEEDRIDAAIDNLGPCPKPAFGCLGVEAGVGLQRRPAAQAVRECRAKRPRKIKVGIVLDVEEPGDAVATAKSSRRCNRLEIAEGAPHGLGPESFD